MWSAAGGEDGGAVVEAESVLLEELSRIGLAERGGIDPREVSCFDRSELQLGCLAGDEGVSVAGVGGARSGSGGGQLGEVKGVGEDALVIVGGFGTEGVATDELADFAMEVAVDDLAGLDELGALEAAVEVFGDLADPEQSHGFELLQDLRRWLTGEGLEPDQAIEGGVLLGVVELCREECTQGRFSSGVGVELLRGVDGVAFKRPIHGGPVEGLQRVVVVVEIGVRAFYARGDPAQVHAAAAAVALDQVERGIDQSQGGGSLRRFAGLAEGDVADGFSRHGKMLQHPAEAEPRLAARAYVSSALERQFGQATEAEGDLIIHETDPSFYGFADLPWGYGLRLVIGRGPSAKGHRFMAA